jgi:hypothetical protein
MPPVAAGIPNGQFVEPDRMRRFTVVPQPFREDDTIDRLTANQLRRPGTINEQLPLQEMMASRVQKLVNRHARTRKLFQSKMLQGGWRYYDPRTRVSIDVSSNIPQHNLFSYKGWVDTVTAGSTVDVMGRSYQALEAMAPDKPRPEGSFFISSDGYLGVPWTYPQADIVRCVKQISTYLHLTNKNKPTHIIMNSQLMAVISSINELFKSFQGLPGMLVNNYPTSTVAGNTAVGASNVGAGPLPISFGPGGEITAIGGLQVVLLDGIWRNPANDNQLEVFWPSHKVAIVSAQSMSDPSAKLGYTYHCSGESWDGKPGLWVETDMGLRLPSQGIHVSAGDCFIPFPVYPHWISLLDVCDPSALYTSLPMLPDLAYGTF